MAEHKSVFAAKALKLINDSGKKFRYKAGEFIGRAVQIGERTIVVQMADKQFLIPASLVIIKNRNEDGSPLGDMKKQRVKAKSQILVSTESRQVLIVPKGLVLGTVEWVQDGVARIKSNVYVDLFANPKDLVAIK